MGKAFLHGGFGASNNFQIIVTAESGSTITCSNGDITKTGISNGTCVFKYLTTGTWSITGVYDNTTAIETVTILESDNNFQYYVELIFNHVPEFTYTGEYDIVNFNGIDESRANWEIHFLTSGTLRFSKLNGAKKGIDAFLVGGGGNGGNSITNVGGGGGGGGFTTTETINIATDKDYNIIIGGSGGETSGFGLNAAAGITGGDGGGGGAGTGHGGSCGRFVRRYEHVYPSNGGDGVTAFNSGTGTLYGAGGGGGGFYGVYYVSDEVDGYDQCPGASGGLTGGGAGGGNNSLYGRDGTPNTGGGGGGAGAVDYGHSSIPSGGGAGGSGIVIIRNKRE